MVVVVEEQEEEEEEEEEEEDKSAEKTASEVAAEGEGARCRGCRSPLGSALQAASREVAVVPFAKATVDGDLRPVVNTVDSTSDGAPRHDMRVSQAFERDLDRLHVLRQGGERRRVAIRRVVLYAVLPMLAAVCCRHTSCKPESPALMFGNVFVVFTRIVTLFVVDAPLCFRGSNPSSWLTLRRVGRALLSSAVRVRCL